MGEAEVEAEAEAPVGTLVVLGLSHSAVSPTALTASQVVLEVAAKARNLQEIDVDPDAGKGRSGLDETCAVAPAVQGGVLESSSMVPAQAQELDVDRFQQIPDLRSMNELLSCGAWNLLLLPTLIFPSASVTA